MCAANFNRPDSRPPPPFSTALNKFIPGLDRPFLRGTDYCDDGETSGVSMSAGMAESSQLESPN
jgi:hypothetical protein